MRIKEYLLKFVAGALCVVMAAILIALFFMNRVRNAERAETVRQKAQEMAQQEQLKKETAEDLYDDLVSSLSMRSIVCWGDTEMAGNGDLSLPKALRETANEKLFAEAATAFSNVMDKEAEPALSVTVSNMGVKNEGMREILVRAGVNELQIGEWTVLPAEEEPHNIVFKDDTSWSPLHFARQSEVRFGKTEIAGITGALAVGEGEYDEDHPRFAFLRDEEGDSIAVGAGTVIEIASATKFIGDIPVFFFEDDSADSVSDFVSDLEDLVERYTEFDREPEEDGSEDAESEEDASEDGEEIEGAAEGSTQTELASEEEPAAAEEPSGGLRYVVICTAEEDSELDDALWEAFGAHYIRNDSYAYEMTEDSYKKLAEEVFAKLDSQGCFGSVKTQIAEAVKQLEDL